jgi:hypothetical protein
MTTKQADKIIKTQTAVTVRNSHFGETFTATFIRRDRYNLYSADGGVFDRGELEIVNTTAREPDREEEQRSNSQLPEGGYWRNV